MLTGPNLPHNWVSDVAPGDAVPLRSRVVQFTEGFIAEAMALMPELGCFRDMLERSRRGVLFGAATAARGRPAAAGAGRAPAASAGSSSSSGVLGAARAAPAMCGR